VKVQVLSSAFKTIKGFYAFKKLEPFVISRAIAFFGDTNRDKRAIAQFG
jgi:hypothetical protein